MAKEQFNCRLSGDVKLLIKAEVARLTGETGRKVTEADVVELAIVKWCSADGGEPENRQSVQNDDSGDTGGRHAAAEAAMRGAESRSAPGPAVAKVNPRAETVAQRRARETKEHAAELAESDVLAKITGRDDIDYDLDNVPHRSVVSGVQMAESRPERAHYQVEEREVKTLTRPHGATEPKRRREQ